MPSPEQQFTPPKVPREFELLYGGIVAEIYTQRNFPCHDAEWVAGAATALREAVMSDAELDEETARSYLNQCWEKVRRAGGSSAYLIQLASIDGK